MGDVICPGCKQIHHETTDLYREGTPPTGDMFKEKKSLSEKGWSSFNCIETTKSGSIDCPQCGCLYFMNDKILLKTKRAYKKRKK